ncbi:MAG: hypothetical protein ABIF01_00485, partial [Candidatus Micrarchaeota archaeon]
KGEIRTLMTIVSARQIPKEAKTGLIKGLADQLYSITNLPQTKPKKRDRIPEETREQQIFRIFSASFTALGDAKEAFFALQRNFGDTESLKIAFEKGFSSPAFNALSDVMGEKRAWEFAIETLGVVGVYEKMRYEGEAKTFKAISLVRSVGEAFRTAIAVRAGGRDVSEVIAVKDASSRMIHDDALGVGVEAKGIIIEFKEATRARESPIELSVLESKLRQFIA